MATGKLIRFNPQQMAAIRARLALIEQKSLELSMMRDGLFHFIEDQTGVDFTRQDWELDLDHAQMTRTARKRNNGSDD